MDFERTTLAATRLYQLAAQEMLTLSQLEKDRLTTDYLFVLAITDKLELNQHDKGRLSGAHLAHLAVSEKIHLSRDDRDKLPRDLLFKVFIEGFADLGDAEMARFTEEQLDTIDSLEVSHSAGLAHA